MTKDENIQKCTDFIIKFKKTFLKNDINNLINFSFLNLSDNEIYHDEKIKAIYTNNKTKDQLIKTFGGYYKKLLKDGAECFTSHYVINDYDDLNISRAINFLLYHDKFPNLEWEDFRWEYKGAKPRNPLTYRGETINTYHSLIKDEESHKEFLRVVFSVGNFMLLPNFGYYNRRLNMIKGNFYGKYKDYADLFFMDLYPDGELAKDGDFAEIIELNKDFLPQTFEEFCEIFYLEDYIENGKPKQVFTKNKINKPYCYWEKSEDEKGYQEFTEQYINKSTEIIKNSAEQICRKLHEKYGI